MYLDGTQGTFLMEKTNTDKSLDNVLITVRLERRLYTHEVK